MRKELGFTLIELMIVVAVVGILAAIAYPSYTKQVQQSRRSDAYNAVASILLNQEKYRANNSSYGTQSQILGATTTSPNGNYTLSISGASASGFTITATGVGNQANDKADSSTACSPLTVVVAGATTTYSPSACWKK